jgi:hypothetical protein
MSNIQNISFNNPSVVVNGNPSLESLKTSMLTYEAAVYPAFVGLMSTGATGFAFGFPGVVNAGEAFLSAATTDLMSWRATSNLFALRDAYHGHWQSAVASGINTLYLIGAINSSGYDNVTAFKINAAIIVAMAQYTVTISPTFQGTVTAIDQLFNLVAAHNNTAAVALKDQLLAGFAAAVGGIITEINAYIIATFGGSGLNAASLQLLGWLYGAYGPAVVGNLTAIANTVI